MFSIYEIALQDANFEIVNVETICIEMQWQRKKLFLSDRVYAISKSVSEISACFSSILSFWASLAMNKTHCDSRITVIIAWLYCIVTNENISSSVTVFANFAPLFAT